jgi:hypothetical protein
VSANVRSQSATTAASTLARHRQQALFEERAHTAARQRLPTRSPLTSNQSLPLPPSFVGPLAVQHSEPVAQQHGRLRLGVTDILPHGRAPRGHARRPGSLVEQRRVRVCGAD